MMRFRITFRNTGSYQQHGKMCVQLQLKMCVQLVYNSYLWRMSYASKNKRLQLRVSEADLDRIAAIEIHLKGVRWCHKEGKAAAVCAAIELYCQKHKLKYK